MDELARPTDRSRGEDMAPCGPSARVADAVRRCQQDRLAEIAGLDRKSIEAIEVRFFAGLVIDVPGTP